MIFSELGSDGGLFIVVEKMLIFNKKVDLLFINFPIIFPIIYCIILYGFPSFENLLIFTTLFLLAEPHFAATFPVFFNKVNNEYILKKDSVNIREYFNSNI